MPGAPFNFVEKAPAGWEMMARLRHILQTLEAMAPTWLAESWDNPGLQVGRPEDPVKKVFVSLDPAMASLKRADEAGADLLLTHHPLVFRPLTQVNPSCYPGEVIAEAIRRGIGIACAHTNLDAAEGGINDILLEMLGLRMCGVIEGIAEKDGGLRRLFVQASAEDEQRLGSVLLEGVDRGSWSVLAGPKPLFGEQREGPGARAYHPEIRGHRAGGACQAEIVVAAQDLSAAIHAIREAAGEKNWMGYANAVYDAAERVGLGRIGQTDRPMSLREMTRKVRETFHAKFMTVVGEGERAIRLVGVVGGSGGSLVSKVSLQGADLLLTGDVGYHQAMEAQACGLSVIDCGHFCLEKAALNVFADRLGDALGRGGWEVSVEADLEEADPRSLVVAS